MIKYEIHMKLSDLENFTLIVVEKWDALFGALLPI
jgi:hypothetical protein